MRPTGDGRAAFPQSDDDTAACCRDAVSHDMAGTERRIGQASERNLAGRCGGGGDVVAVICSRLVEHGVEVGAGRSRPCAGGNVGCRAGVLRRVRVEQLDRPQLFAEGVEKECAFVLGRILEAAVGAVRCCGRRGADRVSVELTQVFVFQPVDGGVMTVMSAPPFQHRMRLLSASKEIPCLPRRTVLS